MITKISKLNKTEIDDKVIAAAAQIIRSGGLVAFPTETVYGLGADALTPHAAGKIYAAKGRPSDNPLIVHVAEFEDLPTIAAVIPPKAKQLAKRFWPGPLTMIFPKRDCVPLQTTGGLHTVAVRMPAHPVALSLIKESTRFVAAPSANISGRPSPTKASHVQADLDGRIPMILDGGSVEIGIESTIVDFCEAIPTILRPGYITKEMIEQIIGTVQMDPCFIDLSQQLKAKAPGMKYRHYAPKGELYLVNGQSDKVIRSINQLAKEWIQQGKKIGIIGTEETSGSYPEGIVKTIGKRMDGDAIARNLYGILREFDDLEVDIIYSERFNLEGIGHAIFNRMLKAADYQILEV
jgi:L-threonylcarbamoyladenylate synthase